jgi:hypothetical protein
MIDRIVRSGGYGAVAVALACAAHAQTPTGCPVLGTVAAGRATLPGVALSLTRADGTASAPVDVTSTAVDGSYVLEAPDTGSYVVKAERHPVPMI